MQPTVHKINFFPPQLLKLSLERTTFSVGRKKKIFGLKVKKKKKDTPELVLANKGAVGKALKTNFHHSICVIKVSLCVVGTNPYQISMCQ